MKQHHLVSHPISIHPSQLRQYLTLVLDAIGYGDQAFLRRNPECQVGEIMVHFHAKQTALDRVEKWGHVQDYFNLQD